MSNAHMRSSGLRGVVALLLVGLLATPTWAQQVSPALLEAARQAYRQRQEKEPASVPARPPQTGAGSQSKGERLRILQVGERIVVETMDNVRHQGTFLAYSGEAISLLEGKREVGYRAENILEVALLGGRDRRKGAEIGFLVGFGAGGAVGAGMGVANRDDVRGAIIAVGLFWGGIGAAIGALGAPREMTVIYRAGP